MRPAAWDPVPTLLVVALYRVRFGLERVEHGQQLGDRQQVFDALGQVEQLQAASRTADRRERADDFAQTGAINVRNGFQVEQELLLAGSQQTVDLFLQHL